MIRRARLCITFGGSLLGLALGACFNGNDAQGLPCTNDLECPVGSSCENGFCGGEPADGLEPVCGNGEIEFGEDCDDGNDNGPQSPCTEQCTVNQCGNGTVDEGEECDDGEANQDTNPCTGECKVNVCGDGNRLEGTEDCDPGGETANCDADCTEAFCGDGYVNDQADELCDNGTGETTPECTSDCTPTVFFEDFEGGAGDWTHEALPDVSEIGFTSGWSVTSGAVPDNGQGFSSGPPPFEGNFGLYGQARLVSPTIPLPEAGTVTLELDHFYDLYDDFCTSNPDPEGDDAAIIEISVGGEPFELLDVDGYDEPVGMACGPESVPFAGGRAFFLHGGDGAAVQERLTIDLSPFAGSEVQLGFSIGWDCFICQDDENEIGDVGLRLPGWGIDNVLIYGLDG